MFQTLNIKLYTGLSNFSFTMTTFIRIAWRNIMRNKKRSLITISAIGFGLGAIIFIWSFIEGAHEAMIRNYTALTTSQIEISQKGFHDNPKIENYISDSNAIIQTIKTQNPTVHLSKRIRAAGLISSSESSHGVMILGVDPIEEKNISKLHKHVKEGSFLEENNAKDIVLGKGLAQNLNIGLDEKVVIMSQAIDGSIAAGAYYIKGLINSGVDEVDKSLAVIHLKAAQELFVLSGVTDIGLRVEDISTAETKAQTIQDKLNNPELEVLPWSKISPSLKQWIEFDNAFVFVILIIVMIVVAIGILNTVLMGVLERTREFGILLAVGTRPPQIIQMIGLESFLLGLLGCVFGVSLGYFTSVYFAQAGVDLSSFTSALTSFYMDAVIKPRFHLGFTMICTAVTLVISCLVSIYPAWYASKLRPVEAIRTI